MLLVVSYGTGCINILPKHIKINHPWQDYYGQRCKKMVCLRYVFRIIMNK